VNSKKMENGKTYYARVKTAYEGLDGAAHTTEWGPVVKFVYRTEKPVIGDINGDGEVNASDATALINHLLGTESYPTNLCDVNGDGEVNSSDVTALINKILGN
ncbi:MAG: dockerin type I domain-containing protein, partial [Streptococcus alactolyticus]|uniref:dockerin type I domain-containing protein n=1 Tax=Streptococcus alactolyticus TaxID=29389 RepID=UPI002A9C5630|nr:dockerin type I domain-containing protein [Streptococcus alactolyticus]